jgi:outer membrane protein assembly factor BamE (lipoprotein component of BamABCDE complex)
MKRVLIAGAIGFVLSAAPATAQSVDESANSLTHGIVQMTLHVGTTTQDDVLETFGAPNITTLDGQGQEVWVYDRQATVTSSGKSGFAIGMVAAASGSGVVGEGGLGFGSSKSNTTQTQRTVTLIIKFGPDKKVSDFKSRSSSF